MVTFEKHTSVYGDLDEVTTLEEEIKRINKHLKELRVQKKEAEARIFEYLKEQELPGFKHRGIAVTISEKKCRHRRNLLEKKEEILQVIQSSRDPTSQESLEEIIEALKGDQYTKDCIKIQKVEKLKKKTKA